MRAMILAAGLGTRLRPLTDDRPKALVELSGRTLLEITLSRLRTFGVTEVIVNVHHFADQVIDYLKSHKNFGMRIEVSREEVLLDTGGGLKKAAWFFLEDPKNLDEPFLLHNVDVISTIDVRAMLQFHAENHALATLAVQSRKTSRPRPRRKSPSFPRRPILLARLGPPRRPRPSRPRSPAKHSPVARTSPSTALPLRHSSSQQHDFYMGGLFQNCQNMSIGEHA